MVLSWLSRIISHQTNQASKLYKWRRTNSNELMNELQSMKLQPHLYLDYWALAPVLCCDFVSSRWVSQMSALSFEVGGCWCEGLHLVDADGQFRVELWNLGPQLQWSQRRGGCRSPAMGDSSFEFSAVVGVIQIKIHRVGLSQHFGNSQLQFVITPAPSKRLSFWHIRYPPKLRQNQIFGNGWTELGRTKGTIFLEECGKLGKLNAINHQPTIWGGFLQPILFVVMTWEWFSHLYSHYWDQTWL